jgi:uncharacterized damage-inducible protein DinB
MSAHDATGNKVGRAQLPEPWLRGTMTDVAAVPRGVLHALELAGEDLQKWCGELTDRELNARPFGLPPVAFHMRHIARSLDRLLSYAEGQALTEEQLRALKGELETRARREELFSELSLALTRSAERVRALAGTDLQQTRTVGKRELPTTVGGLLAHVADHTQRHVGQAVTTAKVVGSIFDGAADLVVRPQP